MKNLQCLKDQEGRKSNIYQLESEKDFCYITTDNNDTFYYKEYQFKVRYHGYDVYGNPLYKLQISKNFRYITEQLRGKVYRCYVDKNYCLIQSYNVSEDIKRLITNL